MDLILRVAAKAVTQEQLTLWMSKLRKKADSSLSVKQVIAVLEYLGGWKVGPVIGLEPFSKLDNKQETVSESREHLQSLWEAAKRLEVSSLPASPAKGQRYLMDVSEPHVMFQSYRTGADVWGFTYKEWWGRPAIRFTSPEGKEFDLIEPIGKDVYKVSPGYGLTPWLYKETGFIAQVSQKLDMPTPDEEKANRAPRTRDNTGSCPCCFKNHKLRAKSGGLPEMVLHGFKRPGWGHTQGSCMGVGFPPYELSPEGTKHLVKMLSNSLDGYQASLDILKSGKAKKIYVRNKDVVRDEVTTEEWDRTVANEISNVESMIKHVSRDLKTATRLVNTWELRELPSEGSQHVTFWKL